MPTMSENSSLTQKDTTFTKIFVGGLPYHTTDKSLREHFEAYGEIEEAVVITDRQTSKSRGYGFVTMTDRQAAERACKDCNPIIDGRKANVNLAYIGAKPRGNSQHGIPLPVRSGYPTIIPGQYGLPPQYIYPPPYVTSPGLIGLPHPSVSPAAAASQFYDFPPTYPNQFTNGFDAFPYSSTAGYLAPSYTYTLPQTIPTAGTPSHFPLPYSPQPQLQETRMQ